MAGETKFTEEEVKSLKELQDSYMKVQNKLGRLSIAKLNFQRQAEDLDRQDAEAKNEFVNLQVKEQELVQELTKKYGQGSLDPTTGVFTPLENDSKDK
tara:strand:- start:3742 stop:4035 length:294 start_codon:yes stop_codon:yes gene_type:complete